MCGPSSASYFCRDGLDFFFDLSKAFLGLRGLGELAATTEALFLLTLRSTETNKTKKDFGKYL